MARSSLLQVRNTWLFAAGLLAFVGAALHLAIPIGGPDWYLFFGAPPGLAAMAEAGSLRPALSCAVIAVVLGVVGIYALSGLGLVRRMPLLRLGLAVIGLGLLMRGVAFIPIAVWNPRLLSGLCGRCDSVNGFLILTSALCLFTGIGYLWGALRPAR